MRREATALRRRARARGAGARDTPNAPPPPPLPPQVSARHRPGLMSAAPAPPPADRGDARAARVASLLSSYYSAGGDGGPGDAGSTLSTPGAGQGPPAPPAAATVDADPEAYAAALLATRPLDGLLAAHAALTAEAKVIRGGGREAFFFLAARRPPCPFVPPSQALDSEMQSLVHENYARFIAAGDTIRSLRGGVREADPAARAAAAALDAAAADAASLNERLRGHSDAVDVLTRVRRLAAAAGEVGRVGGRVRDAAARGDFEAAASAYAAAAPLVPPPPAHAASATAAAAAAAAARASATAVAYAGESCRASRRGAAAA